MQKKCKFHIDRVPTHLVHYWQMAEIGRKNTNPKETRTMAKKNDDRHVGKRENIWFPLDEHRAMIDAMNEIHETNKSTFIRAAVSNYIKIVTSKEEI